MKIKYYGAYLLNNGTRNPEPYEYASKKEAEESLRAIVKGSLSIGDTGRYFVNRLDGTRIIEKRITRK